MSLGGGMPGQWVRSRTMRDTELYEADRRLTERRRRPRPPSGRVLLALAIVLVAASLVIDRLT